MDLAPSVIYIQSSWIFNITTAWSLAEIIRYGYYLYLSIGVPPKTIIWIRYSAFIILYPIGVFSELMTLKDAYGKIKQCCPRVYSFEMPNEFNISFDYLYFIWLLVIPGYCVGFPFLYSYMFQQRNKKLAKLD
jgi:very-long-chain (3R)-3-hydroxyacyl-CoA dehydratase